MLWPTISAEVLVSGQYQPTAIWVTKLWEEANYLHVAKLETLSKKYVAEHSQPQKCERW